MHRLAHAILDQLAAALDGAPPPRVRGLHLPPGAWGQARDGEFGALELEDGSLGLSYLLLDPALAGLGRGASALAGADPLHLARGWLSEDPQARTLGFAAVQALSRHAFERRGWSPPDAPNSIAGLDPRPGESIGMVGHFPPLLRQVTGRGARLTVLELRPELVGERDGVRVTLDPDALAGCTQVLATSTTFLNHSLPAVRAACAAARRFALIGPGAGLWPAPLFELGVTALGGSWITEPPAFVDALRAGESWSRHARKTLLTRADWDRWQGGADGQSRP